MWLNATPNDLPERILGCLTAFERRELNLPYLRYLDFPRIRLYHGWSYPDSGITRSFECGEISTVGERVALSSLADAPNFRPSACGFSW